MASAHEHGDDPPQPEATARPAHEEPAPSPAPPETVGTTNKPSPLTPAPADGERNSAGDVPEAPIDVQLRRLQMLADCWRAGLLTEAEAQQLKAQILAPYLQSAPPRPTDRSPDPGAIRTCPTCGHAKNRATSNRCVRCRREFDARAGVA